MTMQEGEQSEDKPVAYSRRAFLKRGAVLGGGLFLGTTAFAGAGAVGAVPIDIAGGTNMKTTMHGDYLIQLTRFPLLFPINVYLVREDDGFTLVDTGMSGSEKAILAAARQHGGEIRRIVLTHAHGDHVGSLDALRAALPEAEVSMAAREARFLRGERELDPGEEVGELRGSYQACETRPDRELAIGDRVGSLEVVAAPGHTPGQIALLDLRDRSLIAGDAFQTRGGVAVAGTRIWTFPFPAMATWYAPTALASARALRALEPSRLAIGHGDVLTDPLSAMDKAIQVAESKLGQGGLSVA